MTLDMTLVTTGDVTLTDRRTQASWSVNVGSFMLGTTTVTRKEYKAVTGGPPPVPDEEALPASNLSWWQAAEFCNALSRLEQLSPAYRLDAAAETAEWDRDADGYRLPTEAEWEYACRAGTDGPRYGPLEAIAWYRDNSGEQPHPVAGKDPNAWGLYDTLGNVWEWCWDFYDPAVYGTYRVLRGGGWFDEHWSCRASVRRRSHPTLQIDDVGFRVARAAPRAG
ncbi:formylglycine-generating enzyme family protein [Actinoplanes sp. TFC3]|uniref:formylglycine-generating enzyme family protein n=1 Tax=Actinoplanes sp. TFC3 TaxID=1710355 RepID=UPI00191BCE9C|nr:formylglycine-generating enzyme family protein [Actinoplanes sp. TFC3]